MKSKYIIFLIIFISIVTYMKKFDNREILKDTINNSLSTKIYEKHLKIDDENILINCRMPIINYEDKEIERYINSLIRKDINNFMNIERQKTKLEKKDKNINMIYHIPFRNSEIVNIVLKNEIIMDNIVTIEEYSYIFDLKSGQRIFLNHFLDSNIYSEIENYIYENYKNVNHFKINDMTQYKISNGGIDVFDNTNLNKLYFKISYSVFEHHTKQINCERICSNVDTQIMTEDSKYLSSILNIPIITTENIDLDKKINSIITDDIMDYYELSKKDSILYSNDVIYGVEKIIKNIDFTVNKNCNNFLSILLIENDLERSSNLKSYNIDILNNKILKLDDLFIDNSYKDILKEKIDDDIDKYVSNFYIRDDKLIIFSNCLNKYYYEINVNNVKNLMKSEYEKLLN